MLPFLIRTEERNVLLTWFFPLKIPPVSSTLKSQTHHWKFLLSTQPLSQHMQDSLHTTHQASADPLRSWTPAVSEGKLLPPPPKGTGRAVSEEELGGGRLGEGISMPVL